MSAAGGDASGSPARPAVGDELPGLTVRLTRTDLVRYAGASLDLNPIHHSDHAAAALGLPGVIAHGMLTMGLAVRVVTRWGGPEARLLSYAARFTRPVVVPDDGVGVELELRGRVSAVDGDQVSVALEALCAGEKVLGGTKAVVELAGTA